MSIKREFELVNSVNANFKTNSQSEDIKLLPNAVLLAGELLEVIKKTWKSEKSRKEPFWKRRKENNVKTWRKNLINLDEVWKGNHVLCEKDKKEMICKHDLKKTKTR